MTNTSEIKWAEALEIRTFHLSPNPLSFSETLATELSTLNAEANGSSHWSSVYVSLQQEKEPRLGLLDAEEGQEFPSSPGGNAAVHGPSPHVLPAWMPKASWINANGTTQSFCQ